jgi:integrase
VGADAVTAENVEAFLASLTARGKTAATVNRYRAALLRMYALARKKQRIACEPPWVEKLDESDSVRLGFVEPEDFDRIVAELPEDLRDVARFAYTTGWRRGEVLSLTWDRVVLEWDGDVVVGGEVRLPAHLVKNKRAKSIPLGADVEALATLRSIFARRWAARGSRDRSLVFHRFGGRRIVDFYAAWAKACSTAGLSGTYLHDFRRSAARNLRRAGVPEEICMLITGHKTASVFRRYNITDEGDLLGAFAKLSDYTEARRSRPTTRTPALRVVGSRRP